MAARTTPARRPPAKSAGKGIMSSQWHGIPTIALLAGGGVAAYLLYKHFSSSSSSTSATNPTTGTAYPNGYPYGNYGSGGGSSGGGGSTTGTGPTRPTSPPPVPGSLWRSPCPGMPPQWIPPGAISNCPAGPFKPWHPKEPPPVSPASPTSIPVVTTAAAKTAQAQVNSQPSTAATTSSQAAGLGSTPSSSASQVYSQLASTPSYGSLPASTVSQIATQTAAGTGPNGYYGTPSALSPAQVTSLDATNHVTPNAGTPQQQAIASTLSVPTSGVSYQGGWLYDAQGNPLSAAQAAQYAQTFGTGITPSMLTNPPPGA